MIINKGSILIVNSLLIVILGFVSALMGYIAGSLIIMSIGLSMSVIILFIPDEDKLIKVIKNGLLRN